MTGPAQRPPADDGAFQGGAQATGPLAALHYRNYRLLWLGQIVQSEGQWMEQVAQGWLIWDLSHDPFVLGLYGATRSLPALIFALPAGIISDRFNRIRVIQTAQVAACLLALVFGLLVQTNMVAVWIILLFGLLNGTAEVSRMPARQALLSSIVPSQTIMNAVAFNEVGQYTMRIAGPVLAGFIMTAFDDTRTGITLVFYLRAALYLFAVVCTGLIRIPPGAKIVRRGTVIENIGDTFSYLKQNPLLLAVVFIGIAPAMVGQPYQYLLPIFALEIYHVGPQGLGMLTATAGVGALFGALMLVAMGNVHRMGVLMLAGLATYGAALFVFGSTTNFPLALVALLFVGAAQANFMAMRQSLIQLLVRDELRGRVFSIAQLTRGTLSPVGAVLAGTLADAYSAPVAIMALASFLLAVSTGYATLNKGVRDLDFDMATAARAENLRGR